MAKRIEYSNEYIANNRLTEEQRQYLRDHYMEQTNQELAKNMNTNISYVKKGMAGLGLTRLKYIEDKDLLEGEIFKSLAFLGLSEYEVSNYGRVRRAKDRLYMKSYIPKNGYPMLRLIDDKTKTYRNVMLSRLVAHAFIENPDPANKIEVNHIDANKLNNHTSNLEWVTPKENMKHAKDNKLISYCIGEASPNTDHTEEEVHELCRLYESGLTTKEIQKIHPEWNYIWMQTIKQGINWKHISSQYNIKVNRLNRDKLEKEKRSA